MTVEDLGDGEASAWAFCTGGVAAVTWELGGLAVVLCFDLGEG